MSSDLTVRNLQDSELCTERNSAVLPSICEESDVASMTASDGLVSDSQRGDEKVGAIVTRDVR